MDKLRGRSEAPIVVGVVVGDGVVPGAAVWIKSAVDAITAPISSGRQPTGKGVGAEAVIAVRKGVLERGERYQWWFGAAVGIPVQFISVLNAHQVVQAIFIQVHENGPRTR